MGIKGLTKLLADNAPQALKEQKFESYFGRKIEIDASMSIYQFLVCTAITKDCGARSGTEMLTNEAGEVTSYVFDGKPSDMKKQELGKRYAKRTDATVELDEAIKVESMSIGGQTGLKLVRQHGSIETILENINKERYQIPEEWLFAGARRLLKEPEVITDDGQLD